MVSGAGQGRFRLCAPLEWEAEVKVEAVVVVVGRWYRRLAVMVNGSRGLGGWAGSFLALPVFWTSWSWEDGRRRDKCWLGGDPSFKLQATENHAFLMIFWEKINKLLCFYHYILVGKTFNFRLQNTNTIKLLPEQLLGMSQEHDGLYLLKSRNNKKVLRHSWNCSVLLLLLFAQTVWTLAKVSPRITVLYMCVLHVCPHTHLCAHACVCKTVWESVDGGRFKRACFLGMDKPLSWMNADVSGWLSACPLCTDGLSPLSVRGKKSHSQSWLKAP